ncbi:MAG: TIGR02301 family protein [Alphaproteobacteria bacterium]|nr:TIGR02301 family protein [Alphaproteobacteria bacterium]
MRCFIVALAVIMAVLTGAPSAPTLAAPSGDERSYDNRLMRLAEIMGAVHYLRELCDGSDGQRWRDAVNELIKTEGTSALRRATIARRFNLGYRSYRRTYRRCTPSARNTITRFFKEAIEISEALVKLGE